jgi:hypothetical protein
MHENGKQVQDLLVKVGVPQPEVYVSTVSARAGVGVSGLYVSSVPIGFCVSRFAPDFVGYIKKGPRPPIALSSIRLFTSST